MSLESSGNQATVTHQSTGFYGFNINSGGTIGAQYATFEYMDGNGIYLLPGANVHSTLLLTTVSSEMDMTHLQHYFH